MLLLAIAASGVAFDAAAAPTQVRVCQQVLGNNDTNTNEGGNWTYSVANQAITLATPTVARIESESGNAPTCSAATNFPAGSTGVGVILDTARPANWLRDAPGYPQWAITATGLTTVTGSGRTAALSGAAFANASGVMTVTYTIASGRKVNSLCATMVDNATAPAGQGGNITVSLDNGGASRTLNNVVEGAAAVCANGVGYDLPITATALSLSESYSFPQGMAPGFPNVTTTGSGGGTQNTAILSPPFVSTVPVNGVAGDVTLSIAHRIDTSRQVTVCKTVENNGDAVDHAGVHLFSTPIVFQGLPLSVPEDGTETCATPIGIAGSATASAIRETSYPAAFEGMATGYPKWTIADNAAPNTALLSGTGPIADIDWTNAALAGRTSLRVRFVDRAGAFGNGSAANTGAVLRLCKRVEDNATLPAGESGNFQLFGSPVGASAGSALTVPNVAEGNMKCSATLALWAANSSFSLGESATASGPWPGNAVGFPRLRVFNEANPTAASVPLSDVAMAYSASNLSESYGTTYASTAKADRTAVIVNRAGSAVTRRTVQVCLRIDSNGIAPTNSGGFWAGGRHGTLSATEGSGVTCGPVQSLPDTAATWTTPYDVSMVAPPGFPGFDILAGANPVAATPYISYTTSTGQSGVAPMQAVRSSGGVTMNWSPNRDFFAGTTGNMVATIIVRPSAQLQICSQVIDNGDGTNDSNTFTLQDQGSGPSNVFNIVAPVAVTEGAAATCTPSVWLPSTYPTRVARETLPATWNSAANTSGFPQWQVTSSGPAPTADSGSGVVTDPLVQGLAAQQGDVKVTFFNRLGAPRILTMCKILENNNDAGNNSGTFTLSAVSDDAGAPTIGPFGLAATEGAAQATCSAPQQVTNLTTALQATETLPAGFITANGYPKWEVRNSAGAVRASGVGLSTDIFNLSAVNTPDLTVLFRNRAGADADLSVDVTGPPTALVAGTATYTFAVRNDGPLASQGVSLANTTPPGLTFQSATAPCASGFPCNLGTIAPGATTTVSVTYAIPSTYLVSGGANPIRVRATVSATTPDPVSANNTDEAQTAIDQTSDASIVKSNGTTYVVAGDTVTYTLLVGNQGAPVSGLRVQDTLPATLVDATWTCAPANAGATCGAPSGTGNVDVLLNLEDDGVARILVTARVNGAPGGFVTNTASATVPAGALDPDPNNNTSTDNDPIATDGMFKDGFEDNNRVLNVDGPEAKALSPHGD